MDASVIASTTSFIRQYSDQAVQSFESRRKKIMNLFGNKSCPDDGWSDEEIEVFLHEIAMMDSNNFLGSCGVGEREARFASKIVARRHYYMGHGIGRSGDITEIQPKAAGSSLIGQLTNDMVLGIIKSIGVPSLQKCIIVPLATGMSLMLCLRMLHTTRPNAKYVLWPRVDQKSCFKCILTAGLIPIIIRNEVRLKRRKSDSELEINTFAEVAKVLKRIKSDKLYINDGSERDGLLGCVKDIKNIIENIKPENIVCILSTTSSFAPKEPDDIIRIGKLCKRYDVPHLINNAYGIQSPAYLKTIEKAAKERVDLFVSSTDKNFMVPVGGSIICGFDVKIVDEVGKMYPGRGSGTPSFDVFITLLNLGKKGYHNLLQERQKLFTYLKEQLHKVSLEFGEKVLDTPGNCLSVALTLSQLESHNIKLLTEIGSMLFSKFVMGARLVAPGDAKDIGGHAFKNWGGHSDISFPAYLTASATIGVQKKDIDIFIKHLRQVLSKIYKITDQKVMFEVYKSD